MVGDRRSARKRAISDLLLAEHGIYVQPINYPTVSRGTERAAYRRTAYHDNKLTEALAEAMVDV